MQLLIILCGVYNIGFAVFHLFFPRLFKWKCELAKLNFANKGIMQILNVQIIYYFVFAAFVCFFFPGELASTSLGKVFLGGNSLFWLIRTIQQFIFLRARDFRIHILTIIFITGAVLFAVPAFMK